MKDRDMALSPNSGSSARGLLSGNMMIPGGTPVTCNSEKLSLASPRHLYDSYMSLATRKKYITCDSQSLTPPNFCRFQLQSFVPCNSRLGSMSMVTRLYYVVLVYPPHPTPGSTCMCATVVFVCHSCSASAMEH